MVEEDQDLQPCQLVPRARVDPTAKWQEGVGLRCHLSRYAKIGGYLEIYHFTFPDSNRARAQEMAANREAVGHRKQNYLESRRVELVGLREVFWAVVNVPEQR